MTRTNMFSITVTALALAAALHFGLTARQQGATIADLTRALENAKAAAAVARGVAFNATDAPALDTPMIYTEPPKQRVPAVEIGDWVLTNYEGKQLAIDIEDADDVRTYSHDDDVTEIRRRDGSVWRQVAPVCVAWKADQR